MTAQNPDPNTDTAWNDWLPGCGPNGDSLCAAADECCHVYRGLNWTQSVDTCRQYGGDIVTPSNAGSIQSSIFMGCDCEYMCHLVVKRSLGHFGSDFRD